MNATRIHALRRAVLGASALALAALPAHATLKYQPGDYVQDGLVVHLDGIANAGADKPHDPAANVWANLADPANPAKFFAYSSSCGWRNGTGYYFNYDGNISYAQLTTATPAMTQATFEFAFEGSWSAQTAKNWGPTFIAGANNHNISLGTAASPLYFRSVDWTGTTGAGNGQEISNWSWKQASFTFGAAGAGGLKSYDQGVQNKSASRPTAAEGSIPATQWVIGSRLGQNDAGRQLTGTMKSVRIYNRALSADEVAQNAAIDAARFEGVMPVTNAVVATSIAGAFGREVPGVYAVDGSHVFTAAPSAKVGSTTYACTGCTIETWENGAWSSPVTRDGVFAVEVAEGDLKRITWNWAAATGTLASGIDAYSTDGIKVWYDGICNAGKGLPHASEGSWLELVSNLPANAQTNANSHWTDDGYHFAVGPNGEKSYFYLRQLVSLGTVGTIELACDTKMSAQTATWAKHLTFSYTSLEWGSNYDNSMCIQSYKGQTFLRLQDDSWTGNAESQYTGTSYTNYNYRANTSTWDGKHAAFVVDTADHRTYLKGARDNVKPCRTTVKEMPAALWMIGNTYYNGSSSYDQLVGTMKAVRAYGRVLSDAEISRHYSIDVWRFDGEMPISNAVEVVADPRGLAGREPSGVYFPEGWTFAAGANQAVGTVEYAPAGYLLETWDAATGTWRVTSRVPRDGDGAVEWTSPAAAPFASVRLTWLWEPVSGIRRAADYTIADYAPGGMVVWYDGICNDGIGAAHVDNASHRWRELVSGEQANMGVNDNSHWTKDGYYFAVGPDGEKSYAYLRKFVSLGKVGTIELACDTKSSEQTAKEAKYVTFGCTGETTSNNMEIRVNAQQEYLRLVDDAWTGNAESQYAGTQYANWNYRANMTPPWDGKHAAFVIDTDGHRSYAKGLRDHDKPCRHEIKDMPAAYWMIGNKYYQGTSANDQLVGTMKAVRAYNRVLSDAEIAQNYKVDVARFDGALPATNVVVAASDYNGALAADAYEVYGTHVFEGASSSVDGSMPNRVKVWTLENGAWVLSEIIDGPAYTYAAGTSPATVKIEFGKKNPFVLIVR
ncbi:MAG: hypothetical protein IKH04_11460 [Kiritimatiellae bacterium]|nr:hypothetical protein [Kiritimatiellia bacterium]